MIQLLRCLQLYGTLADVAFFRKVIYLFIYLFTYLFIYLFIYFLLFKVALHVVKN